MRVAIRPIVERSPRRAAGRSAGPLGQRHRDRPRLAVAHGRDLHLVAGALLADDLRDVRVRLDARAVDLGDDVAAHDDVLAADRAPRLAGADAGLLSRAAEL